MQGEYPAAGLQQPGEEDGSEHDEGQQDLEDGDERAAARGALDLHSAALGGLARRRLATLAT